MKTSSLLSGALLFSLLIVQICGAPVKQGGQQAADPNKQVTPGPPITNRPMRWSYKRTFGNPDLASLTPLATAFQPEAERDIGWVVAPSSLSERGEESRVVLPEGQSSTEPEYLAGELTHYEDVYEQGHSQRETEDEGLLLKSLQNVKPLQESSPGFQWGYYPYNYKLLNGQYPPGLFTIYGSRYERGKDHWYDDHYVPYSASQDAAPEGEETAAGHQQLQY